MLQTATDRPQGRILYAPWHACRALMLCVSLLIPAELPADQDGEFREVPPPEDSGDPGCFKPFEFTPRCPVTDADIGGVLVGSGYQHMLPQLPSLGGVASLGDREGRNQDNVW